MDKELAVEIDIKDPNNPNSLVNLMPKTMCALLDAIPDDVLMLGESALKRSAKIGVTEERLRVAFWLEYNYAVAADRKVNMPNVYNGVCRKEYWFQIICKDKFKMAYILTPPPDFKISMNEMLMLATEEMRKILTRPHVVIDEETGQEKYIPSLANQKIKIWETATNRIHGATTQRLQVESKQLNVNVDSRDVVSLEDLDRRIKEAEMKLIEQSKKVIDVKEEEAKEGESDQEATSEDET